LGGAQSLDLVASRRPDGAANIRPTVDCPRPGAVDLAIKPRF